MTFKSARLSRESQTIQAMATIYCRGQHNSDDPLCPECQELLEYAQLRLTRCPFQDEKPTCAKCPVHCYKPVMRERVREMMRYAGPRMLWVHPILAVRHIVDGMKEPIDIRSRKRSEK